MPGVTQNTQQWNPTLVSVNRNSTVIRLRGDGNG